MFYHCSWKFTPYTCVSILPTDKMVHRTASPSGSYRLFVSTPAGHTFSLRNLAITVLPSALRAQLELVAGIPSAIYSLHYSSVPISSETELTFGDNVQNGAILSLKFDGGWGRLHEAVCRGNSRETERLCRLSSNGSDNLSTPTASCNGVVTGPERQYMSDMSAEYSRFVALFLSCHRGDFNLARSLVGAGRCDMILCLVRLYVTMTLVSGHRSSATM